MKITTVDKTKKAGWADVAALQKKLAWYRKNEYCAYYDAYLKGRIEGMVEILNMLK